MAELKNVYTIQETEEKNYWIKIGVAFVNRDQSLNVKLNALPIDGKLHIREAKLPEIPKDELP